MPVVMLVSLLCISCRHKHHDMPPVPPMTMNIGALISLTGSGASTGQSSQVSLDLARQDVENYLNDLGYRISIHLFIEDTQTDTAIALRKLIGFFNQGIRLVIGPYSSAELAHLKPFADRHGILLVSPSSVATSLAIPDDNIYRFVTCDVVQGEAISKMLTEDQIKVIIPLIRNDIWGTNLLEAAAAAFSKTGGFVREPVLYDPGTSDFTDLLNQVDAQVAAELTTFNPDEVAVYLLTFGEGGIILHQAGAFDHLQQVGWYGGSAFAQNPSVIEDTIAGAFAVAQGLPCPIFGLDDQARFKWQPLREHIASIIGRDPDVYALTAYDALWVGALTFHMTGLRPEIGFLRSVFMMTANTFFGVTGNTLLNRNGDRAFGNYDFWAVKRNSGNFTWERVAFYNSATGVLTRLVK